MRIASFNMLHGRAPAHDAVDLDRLVTACVSLDADVLALQEVDRAQARSGGFDLTKSIAEAMGSTHWRFAPALIGTPGESWRAAHDDDDPASTEPAYGIALVSRLPVRAWQVVRLPAIRDRAPRVAAGLRTVTRVDDEPRVGLAAELDAPVGRMTIATA
ncbi:MAG: endonuclease/exonuclease/phosphatase family protein, partial [Mycobacteriales bacterium]